MNQTSPTPTTPTPTSAAQHIATALATLQDIFESARSDFDTRSPARGENQPVSAKDTVYVIHTINEIEALDTDTPGTWERPLEGDPHISGPLLRPALEGLIASDEVQEAQATVYTFPDMRARTAGSARNAVYWAARSMFEDHEPGTTYVRAGAYLLSGAGLVLAGLTQSDLDAAGGDVPELTQLPISQLRWITTEALG